MRFSLPMTSYTTTRGEEKTPLWEQQKYMPNGHINGSQTKWPKGNWKDNYTFRSKVERMYNEDEDDPNEKLQRGPKPKPKPKLKAKE
jgi:hypothetical protein